jgi:zinc/manganese transport system permease protein
MSLLIDTFVTPFGDSTVMRRALVGVIALSLGAAPMGVLLMLRRMSLMGDAMAHAMLPGAAIGYAIAGLNFAAMAVGGLFAGFAVALLSGLVARATEIKEEASLATFYLISLAMGVAIVSVRGNNDELLHLLFGDVLAMSNSALLLIAFNATLTLLTLAVIWRPLVLECVDPLFLRSVSRAGAPCICCSWRC